jgi:uncharacterized membrane protein YccC
MSRNPFHHVWTPYFRYKYAKLIHAARVSLAILASILLTTAIGVPYGEWASITVLVVIGGLQHQGNIRRKAAERGLGTMIGAGVGLALILQHTALHSVVVTDVLISVACGVCGYYAIGSAGYVALLSAITLFIVAGHGDNSLTVGLWRTVGIVIGIAIALAFSFALPLYATWSWRYKFADALRGCAALHAGIADGKAVASGDDVKQAAALTKLLVELRSLMPWVAKEAKIAPATMEEIQHSLRLCISMLDLMASERRRNPKIAPAGAPASLTRNERQTATLLIGLARALQLGKGRWLHPDKALRQASPEPAGAPPSDAYALLSRQFRAETLNLQHLLAATESRWNI